MFTLYLDINNPVCSIDKNLNLYEISSSPVPIEPLMLAVEQLKRSVNNNAQYLRCVNLKTQEATTLGELVKQYLQTEKIDLDNTRHTAYIDMLRAAGLTEKLIAEDTGISTKTLQRKYPRIKSVSHSSSGKSLLTREFEEFS